MHMYLLVRAQTHARAHNTTHTQTHTKRTQRASLRAPVTTHPAAKLEQGVPERQARLAQVCERGVDAAVEHRDHVKNHGVHVRHAASHLILRDTEGCHVYECHAYECQHARAHMASLRVLERRRQPAWARTRMCGARLMWAVVLLALRLCQCKKKVLLGGSKAHALLLPGLLYTACEGPPKEGCLQRRAAFKGRQPRPMLEDKRQARPTSTIMCHKRVPCACVGARWRTCGGVSCAHANPVGWLWRMHWAWWPHVNSPQAELRAQPMGVHTHLWRGLLPPDLVGAPCRLHIAPDGLHGLDLHTNVCTRCGVHGGQWKGGEGGQGGGDSRGGGASPAGSTPKVHVRAALWMSGWGHGHKAVLGFPLSQERLQGARPRFAGAAKLLEGHQATWCGQLKFT